jgi:hypothetical protein
MYQESFGAVRSPADVRDYRIACASNETFPAEFELDIPPVKNQGRVGSCVAHAISSVVEYYSRMYGDEEREMSVGYIYGNRTNSKHKEKGMILREAIAVTCEYGDVIKKMFPDNLEVPEAIEKFEKNVFGLFTDGYKNRISSYYKCKGENEIKTALSKKCPVIFSVRWYKDIKVNNGVIETTAEKKNESGRHAMVIYGWNEQGWKIQNSWGDGWGVEGRAILPYDFTIEEAYGVVDTISENLRMRQIEDLRRSNAELQEKISSIIDKLNEVEFELETTQDPDKRADLENDMQDLEEMLFNIESTIKRQTEEIDQLSEEGVKILKPYKSKLGRILAKVINVLLKFIEWIENKK